MIESLAPIVVFSYNRPDHLCRTLEALAKNDLANQSVLYIYCDGAKPDASDEQKERIAKNREVARSTKGFKEVHVVEREKNVGLKNNIVGAVTEIVNRYGRIITLEDDVVSSVGFLKYMNDALELYKDEEKVMHVSAYFYANKNVLPETFFYRVPYPGGGWGTWKRAWDHYNDDSAALYEYWKTRWDEFNVFGGTSLQRQLEDNFTGRINTWFVKWHAVVLQLGGMTLFPKKALTTNIGFDGSGSNCYVTNKFYIEHPQEHVDVYRIPIIENKKAARIARVFKSGHWYSKRNRMLFLKKITRKWDLLQDCISYVVKEVKWKDRSKYGLWDRTATMMKPVDTSALHNLYLYPYARVQPGLRLISYTGKLIVKKYAVCSANALVITGNHVPTVGIPQFYLGTSHINDKESDIIIEEGAWVGAHTTLLCGAKIGRGAVIGASSLVNKEIPPYAVAVGSPARIIATTFTMEQILEHEKIVFRIEERMSKEDLQELFETHFKGLRAIGTDVIDQGNEEAVKRIIEEIAAYR